VCCTYIYIEYRYDSSDGGHVTAATLRSPSHNTHTSRLPAWCLVRAPRTATKESYCAALINIHIYASSSPLPFTFLPPVPPPPPFNLLCATLTQALEVAGGTCGVRVSGWVVDLTSNTRPHAPRPHPNRAAGQILLLTPTPTNRAAGTPSCRGSIHEGVLEVCTRATVSPRRPFAAKPCQPLHDSRPSAGPAHCLG
jgi:hypothetical protein